MMRPFLALLVLVAFVPLHAATFTVTNSNASGAGSLAQAVTSAGSAAGPDTITFDAAVSGQTITPSSVLVIDQDVTIDATDLAVAPTLSGGGVRQLVSVFMNRTVVIRGLNFTAGAGVGGGALFNGGTLTLERCTFSGNTSAANPGGAIFSNGTTTLRDCALFNNTATRGGAIYSNGPLSLFNCTLSGNTSTAGPDQFVNGSGGAIMSNSSVSLTHCTVSGNAATASDGGGLYILTNRTLTLTNTIVAGNTTSGAGPDIGSVGNVSPTGVNLIGDLGGTGLSASATLLTGDPALAALGDFGGPTKTMPPLAGSAVIDAAEGSSEATDQRGASRTSGNGAAADLGAVELGQIVVNTAADENDGIGVGGISLREAIASNAQFQAELIRFDSAVFSAVAPATNVISIGGTTNSFAITVSKPLALVDAGDLPAGLTINDGSATDYGLFRVQSGSTLAFSDLTLADGGGANYASVPGNLGGAVSVAGGGTLALVRCTLSGNQATQGGAINNDASGTVLLTRCTFSGNSSAADGGAIHNNGTVKLTHCTLSGNFVAAGLGGAINNRGLLTLNNSIVAGNTAGIGPDIRKFISATTTATGVNIIGNTSDSGLTADGTTILTGDAKLAPAGLASHGGPTKTIALLRDSPARDVATVSTATADQRGFPILGTADLGAYERQLGPIADQMTDEDTLSAEFGFPVGYVGTLNLSYGQPSLVAGVAFLGSGAAQTMAVDPAPDANGSTTVTVTDSLSGETQSFLLTVNAVNDTPVFAAGADQNVFVDASAQTVPGWATGISAGPADESGQTLTFNVSNNNNALFATQPAVAANGTLTFTPAAGAHGIAKVTVSLSDDGSPVEESASQTFTIGVLLTSPASGKYLAAGGSTPDTAPGAGTNGLPVDAKLVSFGVPATDDAGDIAFVAKWKGTVSGKATTGAGLFINNQCLAIVGGDASAIAAGAKWKSFSDPVVSAGRVACLASLSGVAKASASAVVADLDGVGSLLKIAKAGDVAPDANGAQPAGGPVFEKFKAVSILNGKIAYLAELTGGTPRVTPGNDVGIWVAARPFGPILASEALREGQDVGGKTIKTLVSFQPGNGSPGSGRGYLVDTVVGARVGALAIFADKTQGIVTRDPFFGGAGTSLTLSGDTATGVNNGATFASYSVPAFLRQGTIAFLAKLTLGGGVTKADASGIFTGPVGAGKFSTVIRSGVNAAQAGSGAKFGVLKDPVLSSDGDIAFASTVTGVKGSGAQTLWWKPAGQSLQLLAQGGGDAGDLAGAKFKTFTSLAIAGGGRGPIFAGTLVPGKGGVTAASASGVWACDFTGAVRTLFRTGDMIGGKTVKSFTLLKASVGSAGVTRSFNDAAQVVWLATFTDKTQAIVTTEVP